MNKKNTESQKKPTNPQHRPPQNQRNFQQKTSQNKRNPQQKSPQNPRNPQQRPPQRAQNTRQRPVQKPQQRSRNSEADKAMVAAMRRRNPRTRTRRFRGGNYILYYLLAAVVVIVVLIILSNTVLFKCSQIDVAGNARYKPEEIISVCGITEGDNLLRIDTNEAEKKIADALVYIDSAEVKKSFPTRVEITVTEAEKWYCVEQSGVTAAISRGGKVVEYCAPEDFPVVHGLDAESVEIGAWLKSKTDGKTVIPTTLLNAAEKAGLKNVTTIDITDKFSIKMVIDGRITLELGSSSEAESKLIIAKSIIDSDISETDNVTLLLTNPDKVALRYNQPEMPVQSTTSSESEPSESSKIEPETSEPESPGEPE